MSGLELEIAVRNWHIVDGSLDNSAAVDRVDGTEASSVLDARCARIRETGWVTARQHALAGQGPVGWPPSDSTLVISLELDDWRFVLRQIERWSEWERDSGPAAVFERWLADRVASLES